jgi:hypothetical protein
MPKAIRSPEQRKRKIKAVDNDKARGTIIRIGKTTESTDDTIKATNNKALKASVALQKILQRSLGLLYIQLHTWIHVRTFPLHIRNR